MFMRFTYSYGFVILLGALLALDFVSFVNGGQVTLLGIAGTVAVLMVTVGITLYVRGTSSKPPKRLIRRLHHFIDLYRDKMMVTEDEETVLYARRVLPAPLTMTSVTVVSADSVREVGTDFNLGYKVSTIGMDEYLVQGKGLISHSVVGMKATGTVEQIKLSAPHPISGGRWKRLGVAIWQAVRTVPFQMRTGAGKVSDADLQHLIKQFETAKPVPPELYELG